MLKRLVKDAGVGKRANFSPGKTHWAWHLLLAASFALILLALIFNVTFAERWFSEDHHITDDGKKYLNFFRLALLVMAAGCIVLWILKGKITNYFKIAVKRWEESPSDIDVSTVVPPMHPVVLQKIILLILLLWTVVIVIAFVPGYGTWVKQLTYENGVTETLTVIFYIFASVMALISAVSSLHRNPRNVFFHLWLFCIAVACLLVAMEETNWGDVYLHYKSGEFIRSINYQHDVSLHNIVLPFFGTTYWANELEHILAVCGGVLLPLIIKYSKFFRRLLWTAEFPVPPWLSQACFFIAALIPRDKFVQGWLLSPRSNVPSELREVTISFGFAIWLWATSRFYKYSKHIN